MKEVARFLCPIMLESVDEKPLHDALMHAAKRSDRVTCDLGHFGEVLLFLNEGIGLLGQDLHLRVEIPSSSPNTHCLVYGRLGRLVGPDSVMNAFFSQCGSVERCAQNNITLQVNCRGKKDVKVRHFVLQSVQEMVSVDGMHVMNGMSFLAIGR